MNTIKAFHYEIHKTGKIFRVKSFVLTEVSVEKLINELSLLNSAGIAVRILDESGEGATHRLFAKVQSMMRAA